MYIEAKRIYERIPKDNTKLLEIAKEVLEKDRYKTEFDSECKNLVTKKDTRPKRLDLLSDLKTSIIKQYSQTDVLPGTLYNKNFMCLFLSDLYMPGNNNEILDEIFEEDLINIFNNSVMFYITKFTDVVKPSLSFPCDFVNHVPVNIIKLEDSDCIKDFAKGILGYIESVCVKQDNTDYEKIRNYYHRRTRGFNIMVRKMLELAISKNTYTINSLDEYMTKELDYLIKATTSLRGSKIQNLYKQKVEKIISFNDDNYAGPLIRFSTLENEFQTAQEVIREIYMLNRKIKGKMKSADEGVAKLLDTIIQESIDILKEQIKYIEKVKNKEKEIKEMNSF